MDGPDRIAKLERRLEEVSRSLVDALRRLGALEAGRGVAPGGSAPAPESGAPPVPRAPQAVEGTGLATLAGRTFMVLGGAFLLRALTSSETVVTGLAVGAGMVYAAVWLLLADRAGKAGRPRDASVHGLATAIIAFPMIFESATRFRVLAPEVAAAALLGFGGVALAIAWRRRLALLAYVVTAASLSTGVALLLATGATAVLLGVVLLLAASALCLAEHRRWPGLRLPVALSLDLLAGLALVVAAKTGFQRMDRVTLVALLLSLVVLFLFHFAWTTLVWRAAAGIFEALQSAVVLALCYGGAQWALREVAVGPAVLSASAAAVGVFCLVAAFLVLERREGQQVNLACYFTLGVVLLAEGVRGLFPAGTWGVAWAGLVVAAAIPAAVERRGALRASLALLALAAALASGMVAASLRAFTEPLGSPFPAAGYATLGLVLLSFVLMRRQAVAGPLDLRSFSFAAPGFVLAVLATMGVVGATSAALSPWVAGGAVAKDLGALAALRTGILASAVVLLAGLGRNRARVELIWTAWLLLGVAGLKILADDLPNGRALTLFLTLVLYGGALALAPRLVRKPPQPPEGPSPAGAKVAGAREKGPDAG